jgi:hypothetical protein
VSVWLKEMDYIDVTGGSAASTVNTPGGCFGGQSSSTTTIPTAAAALLSATGCSSATGNYGLSCNFNATIIGY